MLVLQWAGQGRCTLPSAKQMCSGKWYPEKEPLLNKNCLLEALGHFAADYTQAIQLCLETLGAAHGEKGGGELDCMAYWISVRQMKLN